jgi:NADH-quinone oxidoreductase subunit L
MGLATAAITAFYMWRLHFRTFFGELRRSHHGHGHEEHPIHEPHWTVLAPLVVLALFSFGAGFFGLPQIWGDMLGIPDSNALGGFLHGVLPHPEHTIDHATELRLALLAIGAALVGTLAAAWMYVWSPGVPAAIRSIAGPLHRLVENKYYVDQIYDALIVRPLVFVSDKLLYRVVDAGVIDGAFVNGTALGVRGLAAGVLKYAQSGLTQGYLITMVVGTLLIVVWMLR